MLAFASATWDGWDYIPEAWDAWLAATDGLLLVAETTAADVDAEGRPVAAGRIVALARVTLLAAGEAWIEGIRVDRAVRGRDVATNLQVAELAWAVAHEVEVVRYVTGAENEGSHRLGARHGFRRLPDRRAYGVNEPDAPDRPPEPSAAHLLPPQSAAPDIERYWSLIGESPTFTAGDGLYEWRRWAFQSLTRERFAAHVRRGEVNLARDDGALAIVPRPSVWPHDGHSHGGADVALLAGDAQSALSLLTDLARAMGARSRIRLPDPLSGFFDDRSREAWSVAGFAPHEGVLHLLGRDLQPGQPLPAAVPAGALTLLEPPRRIAQAPAL